MYRTVKVLESQRAALFRAGKFVRLLPPGTHSIFNLTDNIRVHVFDVVRAEVPLGSHAVIDVLALASPATAAENLVVVSCGYNEAAIVSMDGQPTMLVLPETRRMFWRCVTRIDVERINLDTTLEIEPRLQTFAARVEPQCLAQELVHDFEACLLFVDGALRKVLAAGDHAFWKLRHHVELRKLDLRAQASEITAQELLTKDRVSVRVTLTCFWRIIDPAKLVANTSDHPAILYRLVQFAIRAALAARALDEALDAREALDAEVQTAVRTGLGDIGLAIDSVNVKDVILPGDMRTLLNRVVEAEKVAQANLIRRREETAATRSALNTARLMDDNPTLMRLKELETLERLVEKVDRIDLHAGAGYGLDALLEQLLRSKRDATPS